MDEDFTTAMQSGARELVDQANLPPAHLIRAQGDQRRRRRNAGGVGLLLIAGAAIGGGIVHLSGPGQPGTVSTTSTATTTSPTTAIPTPTIPTTAVPTPTVPTPTNPTTSNPTPTSPTTSNPTTSQTSSPDGTPTTTPTVSKSSTTGGIPATASATPACKTAQLKITYGGQTSGAGHLAQPLLFLNTGSTACQLHGYPSVTILDDRGQPIAQARQTLNGYMGGLVSGSTTPPTVVLAPGVSASAVMEAIPSDASGPQCPAYHSVLVTPPNGTDSVSLSWTLDRCSDLEVHPVVPGSTGRSG